MSPNDDLKIKLAEIELKRLEIEYRKQEIGQQDKQRRTSALVTIFAAFVTLVATLGSQFIATSSADRSEAQKSIFSLQIGSPLLKDENAGVYMFDAKKGHLWIATTESGNKASWVLVPPPTILEDAP